MNGGLLTAILTIVASVLGLWLWYVKRARRPPSTAQRTDEITSEILAIESEMARLRRAGDHAGADALLRRLRVGTGVESPPEPDGGAQ